MPTHMPTRVHAVPRKDIPTHLAMLGLSLGLEREREREEQENHLAPGSERGKRARSTTRPPLHPLPLSPAPAAMGLHTPKRSVPLALLQPPHSSPSSTSCKGRSTLVPSSARGERGWTGLPSTLLWPGQPCYARSTCPQPWGILAREMHGLSYASRMQRMSGKCWCVCWQERCFACGARLLPLMHPFIPPPPSTLQPPGATTSSTFAAPGAIGYPRRVRRPFAWTTASVRAAFSLLEFLCASLGHSSSSAPPSP